MSLPPGRGGVDLLGQALEADPPLGQGGHHLDQVLERAAQAIEPPDDEGVPFPEIGEDVLQDGPLGLRATGRFLVDLAAAGLLQRIELQVEGLFPGRDPGIANIHALIVSKPREQCK